MKSQKKNKAFEPSDNQVPNKVIVNRIGLVEKMIYDGDVVRVTSARQMEYLNGSLSWNPREFVKANVEEIRLVLPELSTYERAFLASVQPNVGYQDCLLKVFLASGERDVILRDLVEITGIGKTKLIEVIRSLREKDILYVGENSKNHQYFVNPWIFCKGARVNKVLAAMFQNYRVRSMGGVKWKDLGS